MSSEVSLSSIGFDELDRDERSSCSSNDSPGCSWHKSLFAEEVACRPFRRTASSNGTQSTVDQKIQKLSPHKNTVRPMGTGGSVSVEASISWGGSQGTTGSIGISAEAHDDRGNQVEISVEQNSNGEGSANISASHDTDK